MMGEMIVRRERSSYSCTSPPASLTYTRTDTSSHTHSLLSHRETRTTLSRQVIVTAGRTGVPPNELSSRFQSGDQTPDKDTDCLPDGMYLQSADHTSGEDEDEQEERRRREKVKQRSEGRERHVLGRRLGSGLANE